MKNSSTTLRHIWQFLQPEAKTLLELYESREISFERFTLEVCGLNHATLTTEGKVALLKEVAQLEIANSR